MTIFKITIHSEQGCILFKRLQMCLSFLNSFQEGYKMRETEFERLKKDSESFFYTSLEHTEYVDIQEYDVFQNETRKRN
jgi:hypothetical protein